MPIARDSAAFTHAILQGLKRASHNSNAEEAAKAKALINVLMQDRFFLALYRSNDPNVRATAVNELSKAHHQAYGDASTKDDDAGTGCK